MPALPPVHRWEVSSPRGLVHIVHGMAEYGARYARLAAALNAAGLTVWAHDHCGHGDHMSVDGGGSPAGTLRRPRRLALRLLDDAARVSQAVQASSPGTPLLLFAHSMGSFVAKRCSASRAIAIEGSCCAAATGRRDRSNALAWAWPASSDNCVGPRTPSRWFQRVVFGTVQPAVRTEPHRKWTGCRATRAEVDAYVADPLCGFPLTTQAWLDFLEGKSTLGDAQHLRAHPEGACRCG